jgi:hypothetical protein
MKLLLPAALLLSLCGCYQGYERGVVSQSVQTVPTPCKRQQVYCYLTNYGSGDTLLVVPAKLVVDDSLVVSEDIQRSNTEYPDFIKIIRLCEGAHRVHVQFGPYTRDTTFVVSQKISLIASMLCYDIPELAHENGLAIDTLHRVD